MPLPPPPKFDHAIGIHESIEDNLVSWKNTDGRHLKDSGISGADVLDVIAKVKTLNILDFTPTEISSALDSGRTDVAASSAAVKKLKELIDNFKAGAELPPSISLQGGVVGATTIRPGQPIVMQTSLSGTGKFGDVIGPNSAGSGNIVVFQGGTGKKIADSGVNLSELLNLISGISKDFSGLDLTPSLRLGSSVVVGAEFTTSGDMYGRGLKFYDSDGEYDSNGIYGRHWPRIVESGAEAPIFIGSKVILTTRNNAPAGYRTDGRNNVTPTSGSKTQGFKAPGDKKTKWLAIPPDFVEAETSSEQHGPEGDTVTYTGGNYAPRIAVVLGGQLIAWAPDRAEVKRRWRDGCLFIKVV